MLTGRSLPHAVRICHRAADAAQMRGQGCWPKTVLARWTVVEVLKGTESGSHSQRLSGSCGNVGLTLRAQMREHQENKRRRSVKKTDPNNPGLLVQKILPIPPSSGQTYHLQNSIATHTRAHQPGRTSQTDRHADTGAKAKLNPAAIDTSVSHGWLCILLFAIDPSK